MREITTYVYVFERDEGTSHELRFRNFYGFHENDKTTLVNSLESNGHHLAYEGRYTLSVDESKKMATKINHVVEHCNETGTLDTPSLDALLRSVVQ